MTSINQRPYKVWSCNREIRKSIVASSLFEIKIRGAEKLGYDDVSELRLVLESDGTEVEDDSYFQTAEKDTIFLLLKPDEHWLPRSVEALKSAIKAIPKIVCDAITNLELTDKEPSWKIMDEKGNITVVLNWDQSKGGETGELHEPSSWRVEVVTSPSSTKKAQLSSVKTSSNHAASSSRANLLFQDVGPRPTMIRTLPFGISVDEIDEEYEKIDNIFSPNHEQDNSQCDFHCAALHRGGGQIIVTRSAATSPIREVVSPLPGLQPVDMSYTGAIPKRPGSVKGHVRFTESEPIKIPPVNGSEDSESTETYDNEELCERYLLLVDQLSASQERHLSVKDIGTILERLSSKIVDIDRLEREKESQDCHNWVIKATIRGDVLREIGVIYNGHYYGIMEHPGYF